MRCGSDRSRAVGGGDPRPICRGECDRGKTIARRRPQIAPHRGETNPAFVCCHRKLRAERDRIAPVRRRRIGRPAKDRAPAPARAGREIDGRRRGPDLGCGEPCVADHKIRLCPAGQGMIPSGTARHEITVAGGRKPQDRQRRNIRRRSATAIPPRFATDRERVRIGGDTKRRVEVKCDGAIRLHADPDIERTRTKRCEPGGDDDMVPGHKPKFPHDGHDGAGPDDAHSLTDRPVARAELRGRGQCRQWLRAVEQCYGRVLPAHRRDDVNAANAGRGGRQCRQQQTRDQQNCPNRHDFSCPTDPIILKTKKSCRQPIR